MSAGGRRNGLQGRYSFLCFFRPSDERKIPDKSDLMNYLIRPSDWSATWHSKPQRSYKNFLFYLTFRMLQHTSSEVNGYNCDKHLKKYKNKEGNW